jgi:spore germination protein KA/spore germination protein
LIRKLSAQVSHASIYNTKRAYQALSRKLSHAREIHLELQKLTMQLYCNSSSNTRYAFAPDLSINKKIIGSILSHCQDVKQRNLKISRREALLLFIDGMSDTERIETVIIRLLDSQTQIEKFTQLEEILPTPSLQYSASIQTAISALLHGSSLLFINGLQGTMILDTVKFVKRQIQEPKAEISLFGPYDSFNETLQDNLVLIRRRAADANLKTCLFTLGTHTATTVALLYIEQLAKTTLIEEVSKRLKQVTIDTLQSVGMLEEHLSENPWSPFPFLQITQRPDKVATALYEGRFAILIDSIPWALIGPCTYQHLLQSHDDYAFQPVVASLIRLTRHVSVILAVLLPGFYISVVSYQTGIFPSSFLLTIATLRATAPFPAYLEAILMEIILELFQEAINRLPSQIVVAASVVGAYVIGTTVVEAGIINPLLVVVMAMTAIASYTIPSYDFSLSLRWFRIPVIILASTFGLYGVVIGSLFILTYMISLHNFGESFMGDVFDVSLPQDWKDGFIRLPSSLFKTRTKLFGADNRLRKEDEPNA